MKCPVENCRIDCISEAARDQHVRDAHPSLVAPDVRTSGWGQSLVVFELVSDAAKEWVREYVEADPYQWLGPNRLCVEHRYAPDIVNALAEAGLEVA